MLWYKSWLETRWRFIIGIALLILSAASTVFTYPQIQKLIPLVPTNIGGHLGEQIRESAALARTFHGYVWSNWFRQNLIHLATLFSVLLGTGGLLSQSSGVLFTLSLPVSRNRLLAVRAASGLAELFVLALVPSFVIPLFAPAIGERYAIGNEPHYLGGPSDPVNLYEFVALLNQSLSGDETVLTDAGHTVLDYARIGLAHALTLSCERIQKVPAAPCGPTQW